MGAALRLGAVVAAAILVALAVSACGGDDDSTTTGAAATTNGATQGDGPKAKPQNGSDDGKQGNGSGSAQSENAGSRSGPTSSDVDAAPLRVSGGGSGQYRTRGGDNSIQDFGEEGDESELQAAAKAVHGFYVARAEEDWATACSYLAQSMKQQLQQLAARSEQLKGKGCAGILKGLTAPLPSAARRETTVVDAGSLRIEGEQAFLIYDGADKTTYAIPVKQEGDGWKVAALAPFPLS